jgi:hypothetical protein
MSAATEEKEEVLADVEEEDEEEDLEKLEAEIARMEEGKRGYHGWLCKESLFSYRVSFDLASLSFVSSITEAARINKEAEDMGKEKSGDGADAKESGTAKLSGEAAKAQDSYVYCSVEHTTPKNCCGICGPTARSGGALLCMTLSCGTYASRQL